MKPTRRTITLALLTLVLAFATVILAPAWWAMWLILVAGFVGLCLFDLLSLPGPKSLQWTARLPKDVSIGSPAELSLRLRNLTERATLHVQIRAQAHGALRQLSDTETWIAPQSEVSLPIPAEGWRRGAAHVAWVQLEWRSSLGLFTRTRLDETPWLQTRVTPNVKAVRDAGLRAQQAKQYLQGLKIQRYIGDGREFDTLREFQPGHDIRAIDWSASARSRTLQVREYREEKNHSIIIAVESGRLMSRNIGQLARLDHAINAALHLAYVSLQAGDRIGLFGFDSQTRCWLPPTHHRGGFQRFLDATDALPYTLNVSDFRRAIIELEHRVRRRSIIVLFTDLDSLSYANDMMPYLQRLRRKHVVIVVAVGEGSTIQIHDHRLDADNVLETVVATDQLRRSRAEAIHRIASQGIRTIDVPPEDIAVHLLNHYLEIKRRGLI